MSLIFGLWLACHEIAGIIILLVYEPDRVRRRQMRERLGEYKFFLIAPLVVARSVVQVIPEWLREDVLRLPPATPRNLLCEK